MNCGGFWPGFSFFGVKNAFGLAGLGGFGLGLGVAFLPCPVLGDDDAFSLPGDPPCEELSAAWVHAAAMDSAASRTASPRQRIR